MNAQQASQLGIGEQWVGPLNETFAKYSIDTPKRQACFLGQLLHESGGFKFLKENLNYSAKALMNTWPSRFPDMDIAEKYEHNPSKIAGKVYVGRMGNETEEDAQKYIGRGLIQLTGKDNYKAASEALGVDLIGQPQLLEEPRYAALSAGWFWNKKGLNALADAGDIDTMTKRINGGSIGIADRKAKIDMVSKYLVA